MFTSILPHKEYLEYKNEVDNVWGNKSILGDNVYFKLIRERKVGAGVYVEIICRPKGGEESLGVFPRCNMCGGIDYTGVFIDPKDWLCPICIDWRSRATGKCSICCIKIPRTFKHRKKFGNLCTKCSDTIDKNTDEDKMTRALHSLIHEFI